MRQVLIAYATRLGAARDIAEALASELRGHGDVVRLECIQDAPGIDGAELVIFGSGINAGHYYPEAVAWLSANESELKATNVAVFNTCLNAANPEKIDEAEGYNAATVATLGAVRSATFAGRYEKAKVGWWARLWLKVLRKQEQDHVDRDAARCWVQALL